MNSLGEEEGRSGRNILAVKELPLGYKREDVSLKRSANGKAGKPSSCETAYNIGTGADEGGGVWSALGGERPSRKGRRRITRSREEFRHVWVKLMIVGGTDSPFLGGAVHHKSQRKGKILSLYRWGGEQRESGKD